MPARDDEKYIGEKFGKWSVIKRDLSCIRPPKYICRCDCGTVKSQLIRNIKKGNSKQCSTCADLSKSKELVGKKFGHILVLGIEKFEGRSSAKVKCDCGNERFLEPSRVKNGTYISCGQCELGYEDKTKFYKPEKYLNKKFGMLTIIEVLDADNYIAKCDCGKICKIRNWHIKNKMPCCGCYWKNKRIKNAESMIGYKQGYLKIIKFLGMQDSDGKGKTRAHYLLKCKCGNKIIRERGDIYLINSCGCLQKEKSLKGEKQSNAKLTNTEVLGARELFSTGLYSRKEIAHLLNIDYSHICRILANKDWKSINKIA